MSYLSEITNSRKKQFSLDLFGDQKNKFDSGISSNLTDQQKELALCNPSGIIKVSAFAGAGKTSTLCELAKNQYSKKCVYLAYNKSAQLDASKRFGSNTKCTTVHALAFAAVGRKYVKKLGNLRSIDVIEEMNLTWDWSFADAVVKTINYYCASDKKEFPRSAKSISGPITVDEKFWGEVASVAKKTWEKMCNLKERIVMTHDGYLKLYQLQKPLLDCDLLMLDEAQDTNPVTWDIVKNQKCPIIVVGDAYQSIYGFRGAINAMNLIDDAKEYQLTQSFRFGESVANIASKLLYAFYEEPNRVEGMGAETVVGDIAESLPHGIVCRTNAVVFHRAVQAIEDQKKISFIGGVDAYGFEKLIDVNHLMNGDLKKIKDVFLRRMQSFNDYAQYAEDSQDVEAKRMIEIVYGYRDEVENLVKKIRRESIKDHEKADLIISTAHRSKGMTIDRVVLEDDYPEIVNEKGILEAKDLDRQEINLLYVAVTRAKHMLSLNETMENFLESPF